MNFGFVLYKETPKLGQASKPGHIYVDIYIAYFSYHIIMPIIRYYHTYSSTIYAVFHIKMSIICVLCELHLFLLIYKHPGNWVNFQRHQVALLASFYCILIYDIDNYRFVHLVIHSNSLIPSIVSWEETVFHTAFS